MVSDQHASFVAQLDADGDLAEFDALRQIVDKQLNVKIIIIILFFKNVNCFKYFFSIVFLFRFMVVIRWMPNKCLECLIEFEN